MKIETYEPYTSRITNLLKQRLEYKAEEREGIHASDFVFCPAKYFLRNLGYEETLDHKTTHIFSLGISHHLLIQQCKNAGWIYEKELCLPFQVGNTSDYVPVYFTIDLIGIERNVEYPVEIKSTRKRISKKNIYKISDHYLKQLQLYCLATKQNIGVLIIWSIVDANMVCYKIHYTNEEMQKLLNEIKYKLEFFTLPIAEQKNYPKFPLNYPEYWWECNFCRFKKYCKIYETRKN